MNRMTPALARLLVEGREDKTESGLRRTPDPIEPTATMRVPGQRRGRGLRLRIGPRTGVRLAKR